MLKIRENDPNFKNLLKAHFYVYKPNLALFTAFFSKNRELKKKKKLITFGPGKWDLQGPEGHTN